jgi:hypothetical protein
LWPLFALAQDWHHQARRQLKTLSLRRLQTQILHEQMFDLIVSKLATLQLHFLANKVVDFRDVASILILDSPTTTISIPNGSRAFRCCNFRWQKFVLGEAASSSSEGTICAPDSHLLLFRSLTTAAASERSSLSSAVEMRPRSEPRREVRAVSLGHDALLLSLALPARA